MNDSRMAVQYGSTAPHKSHTPSDCAPMVDNEAIYDIRRRNMDIHLHQPQSSHEPNQSSGQLKANEPNKSSAVEYSPILLLILVLITLLSL